MNRKYGAPIDNFKNKLFDIDVDHYFDVIDLSWFVLAITLYIIATCVISTIVVWFVDYWDMIIFII